MKILVQLLKQKNQTFFVWLTKYKKASVKQLNWQKVFISLPLYSYPPTKISVQVQALLHNKEILPVHRRWCCPSCPTPRARSVTTTGLTRSWPPSAEEEAAVAARPTRPSRPSRGSGRSDLRLSVKTRTARSQIRRKEDRRRIRRLQVIE